MKDGRYEERMIMVFSVVLICLINTNPTLSCSCRISHPQQHFCHSDFVVQAKVMKSITKPTSSFQGIHIKIRKAFKMTDKAKMALRNQIVWTASEENLCGIHLQRDQKYIISGKLVGKKAWISLCDYVEKWSKLTRKQRKGFRMLYKRGCQCKIRSCPEFVGSCPKSKSTCLWKSVYDGRYDCQSLQTVCIPQKNGLCGWNDSRIYRNCLKIRDQVKRKQREFEM